MRNTVEVLRIGVENSLKGEGKKGQGKVNKVITKPYFGSYGFLFWILIQFVVKCLIRYSADCCKISAAEGQAM